MSFATAVRSLFAPITDPLAARIAAVEARPVTLSDADRALLDKVAVLIAEIEAAAGGAAPADPVPPADDGSITVTDVQP